MSYERLARGWSMTLSRRCRSQTLQSCHARQCGQALHDHRLRNRDELDEQQRVLESDCTGPPSAVRSSLHSCVAPRRRLRSCSRERADVVRVAIARERRQKVHLRPRGLDRDHVGVERDDGLDDVAELGMWVWICVSSRRRESTTRASEIGTRLEFGAIFIRPHDNKRSRATNTVE
jgi:hypothetical protein